MVAANGELFLQLGLVVVIAALFAFVFRLLRQPQILSYVIAGILIPIITPLVGATIETSVIESMSIIGIAFLLFIVGMEIDIKKLKNVALVSNLGGTINMVLLFGTGYLAALFLGFIGMEASYMGLMLVFSSTMVVMKLLSDKKELNTLHGRIVVGILLLEDIVAIFALSILSTVDSFTYSLLGIAFMKFAAIFAVAFLCSEYIFPRYFKYAAKNQELLLISSLAICFIFSIAFHYMGFSLAIGAFLAGVTLGNLDYNLEIIGKVKSLRDFFSLLFFVSLGMRISLDAIKEAWFSIVVLILLIVTFKPFLIMTVCSLFKYTKKPAFFTATSLAQIGEFSLILAAQGLMIGHISNEFFSLIVVVMLSTITITSYYIKYNQEFYSFLEKPLKIFDIFSTERLEYLPNEAKPKIVLCGHNRIGYSILRDLHTIKKKVLVIDFNPEVINRMVKKGYHCIYGEVTDEEIIERMNLKGIKILVSTVPDLKDNLYLIKKVRSKNKKAKIIVTSSTIDNALKLYEKGADYVVLPHFLGGEHASNLITGLRKKNIRFKDEKKKQIELLKERKNIGQEHPN